MPRILHLLDPTTPEDSLHMLALGCSKYAHDSKLAALGHHSTAGLAALAGIPPRDITFLPSAGWADPAGWRALQKLIRTYQPSHLHAWGVPAAIAIAVVSRCCFAGTRLLTLADFPTPSHLRLLRYLARFTQKSPFILTATSPFLLSTLASIGIPDAHLTPPAIAPRGPSASADLADLKSQLGIASDDTPILLLGGDGPRARHDLGLWTAAILQHLYPRLRTVVRQDARGRPNLSLDRFLHDLADENMRVIAPPDTPWHSLVQLADILFIPADSSIPVASILAAMSSDRGVPIVSAPNPSLAHLLTHNETALIAPAATPRLLTAQLERLLTGPALAQSISQRAHAYLSANLTPAASLAALSSLYDPTPAVVASGG